MQNFPLYPYSFLSHLFWRMIFLGAAVLFAGLGSLKAQEVPQYDELAIELHIPKVGTIEIPVALQGEEAYISVRDLFDYLKIKNEVSEPASKISGYLLNPQSPFSIDPVGTQISFKGEIFRLPQEDFIITPTTMYLKSTHFGRVFGLHTDFNLRSLTISLTTELELPIIRELRLQKMRNSLDQVKGIVVPDTLLERSYPFFRAGMADWAVITTQQSNGENDNRFNFGLGTMLAGGETNLLLNYSNRIPFTSRNQFYQWKYVDNESTLFKQVTAGKIYTRSISSLFAPVVGVQFSNSPVQNRRSFGSYTLSDVTEPRWTVELYVNNVLVDFVEADASGFYKFEVPLMYGNTAVNLRFYGPYGEERMEERVINIPYNFIPENEFEYTLSAGVVEDGENRKFSRFNLNYGLGKTITLGGGVEYLSGVASGEFLPFINSSIKLTPSLLFSGQYTYGVKGEGLLSYRTPSNMQLELNYINYDRDQTAINYNYLEERKLIFSMPLRYRVFSAYTRLSLNQIVLPSTSFTTAQWLISGMFMGVSTNLTTYGLYNDRTKDPTIYSTVSQTYRLPYRFLFSPQLQYDFGNSHFTNFIVRLERPVFNRGFFNIGYENNLLRNIHSFEVGLRYSFDFMQAAVNTRYGNQNSSYVQSARGSILFNDQTGYAAVNNSSSVGKAALTIIPFLDLNDNGTRDAMEPEVPGVKLKNTGGRVVYNENQTVLRIYDLQPYVQILLEIDPVSLDNIAWKIRDLRIAVETIPNQFQTIYIPVQVLGEVAGMVYYSDASGSKGQGRIIVNIIDSEGEIAARILTEGDGYFSFLGLSPGNYKAVIDSDQLKTLNYKASPAAIDFEVQVSEFGDIIDDLEFNLEPIAD